MTPNHLLGQLLTGVLIVGLIGAGLALQVPILTGIGGLWLVLEVGFRLGVYLGHRAGYTEGVEDGWRRVASW